MYLAKGTAGDSIANILPQNIWVRLVLYLGILCVLFTLLSLPQIISELKARKNAKVACVSENECEIKESVVLDESAPAQVENLQISECAEYEKAPNE